MSASMLDTKNRMKTIESTRKITRAMYMLSSARMKKASMFVEANRHHFLRVRSAIKDILLHSETARHPYLEARPGGRTAYIVISGDKGLCGGYNYNVLSYAVKKMPPDAHIFTVGYTARDYFRRHNWDIDIEFLNMATNPRLRHASQLSYDITSLYDNDQFDEAYLIYTRFESASVQYPNMIKLLPVNIEDYADVQTDHEYQADMIYHPSVQEVFDTLVPQYVTGLIFGAMVQSYASENRARMIAMESSTNNADEMLQNLTLEYNRARQYAITQEISELISGQMAFE